MPAIDGLNYGRSPGDHAKNDSCNTHKEQESIITKCRSGNGLLNWERFALDLGEAPELRDIDGGKRLQKALIDQPRMQRISNFRVSKSMHDVSGGVTSKGTINSASDTR